jgi:adenylate kinase
VLCTAPESIVPSAASGRRGARLRRAGAAAGQEGEVNILLLGPQGSGKGTQANRIAEDFGVAHIATGEMLRNAIAAETPLGLAVKPIVERGDLVPDALMIDLIRERLDEEDTREGFVLDGFPRTMAQAEALDSMLAEIGRDLDVVFELQIDDDVAVDRLAKRALAEGRNDDTPEAIARRLSEYHEKTEPLVGYYRLRGNLVGVHGENPIDEVFAEIQDALQTVAARS